MQITKWQRSCR